jgi:hypothetical protein
MCARDEGQLAATCTLDSSGRQRFCLRLALRCFTSYDPKSEHHFY